MEMEKISMSIDKEILDAARKVIKEEVGTFRNISHFTEYAIRLFIKEKEENKNEEHKG